MPASEIIETLERGGFDFSSTGWKEKDRLRSFTITLSKNTVGFHRLPNGYFGLPKWYPEALKQKQAARAERETAQDEHHSGRADDLDSGE